MMGKDCERIVKSIDGIKNYLQIAIGSMAEVVGKKMYVKEWHLQGDEFDEMVELEEKEMPVGVGEGISNALSIRASFADDGGKLANIEKIMFAGASNFFNSVGSPFAEIHKMETAVDRVGSFVAGHDNLKFMGEKIALLCLLNTALSCTIDAKLAMLMYHDYIQRGYDAKYNTKKPAITFSNPKLKEEGEEDVKGTKYKETMGNIAQDFDENVNNKGKNDISPF